MRLLNILDVKLTLKNFYILFTILVLCGFLSAFQSDIIFILIFTICLFIYVFEHLPKIFILMSIFLHLQAAIVYNLVISGYPDAIVNFINRIDEVIWVALIALILLIRYEKDKWLIDKTYIDSYLIVFVLLYIFSLLYKELSIFWGSVAIILSLKGIFIFWIAQNFPLKKDEIILFFKTNIYIFVFVLFVGFLQVLLGVSQVEISGRLGYQTVGRFGVNVAVSIYKHHSMFGTIMGIAFCMVTGIYVISQKREWGILSILFILGIIFSTVRRTLIGIVISFLILFLLLNYLKIPKKNFRKIWIGMFIFGMFFAGRFGKVAQATSVEYSNPLQARYQLYFGAYNILKNHPFFGEGPGTFGSYVSVVTKSGIYKKYNVVIEDEWKMDAFWASIAGEYGIIGIVLYILMLLVMFKKLVERTKYALDDEKRSYFEKGLYVGFIMIFINLFFESLTVPIYSQSMYCYLLFSSIGFLLRKNMVNKQLLIH